MFLATNCDVLHRYGVMCGSYYMYKCILTKETQIKLSAVWDLKACSGTPLCLMMHVRAT